MHSEENYVQLYMLTPIRCYDENEDLFAEALAKDLRKPRQEAVMFEVTFVLFPRCENENYP